MERPGCSFLHFRPPPPLLGNTTSLPFPLSFVSISSFLNCRKYHEVSQAQMRHLTNMVHKEYKLATALAFGSPRSSCICYPTPLRGA